MKTSRKKPFDGVAAIDCFKTHPPAPERIRQRAHEIYLARGGPPGRELDDWLQAESELQQEPDAERSGGPRTT